MSSDDRGIQGMVIREIGGILGPENTDLHVEVEQGVVVLSGTVTGYPKRAAAQEAARRVAGVRYVMNHVHPVVRGRFAPHSS